MRACMHMHVYMHEHPCVVMCLKLPCMYKYTRVHVCMYAMVQWVHVMISWYRTYNTRTSQQRNGESEMLSSPNAVRSLTLAEANPRSCWMHEKPALAHLSKPASVDAAGADGSTSSHACIVMDMNRAGTCYMHGFIPTCFIHGYNMVMHKLCRNHSMEHVDLQGF